MPKFKDDKFDYIESDIEKIQRKSGMYISYVGKKGALHLTKELIQNAIDECENINSPCKNILIKLNTDIDTISVEDDGRGIPEDSFPLDIICTKLQSGSKFTREQGGKSSGENGVGLTATNALSSFFSLSSYRDGKVHTIEFEEGIKTADRVASSTKEHGTIVKFSPSKKYLGKSTCIPKKELLEWVESISYFIPKRCKIVLEVYKGDKLTESYKYKMRPIEDLLKSHIVDEMNSPIITLNTTEEAVEDIIDMNGNNKKVKRSINLEFSFVYSNSLEPYVDSFCNYINTTSGGVHLDATREAIWRVLMKKATEALSDKEKEKYKILKVDIEQGLNLVLNMSTDMQMQFVGQTKNAVGNDDLYDPIKTMVTNTLLGFFSSNKDVLNTIIKLIKLNCKARLEASKVRFAVIKETVNKFDKFKFDKFTACNNEGKAYKELHLCEGQSAMGSLVDGRDPDTQAFLAFRGLGANGFKRDASTILDNTEWRTYVTLLKTNFGPKFDLSKCYYDKIIIETDSDVDGYGITSIICAFHALYLPEIVKAGKLYKSVAPLYHIDDKKHEFVRTKREYVSIYQDKIIKNYDVKIPSIGDGKISKSVFKDFIYDTQEYEEDLIDLANFFGVNKFLIERIAAYILMNYGPNADMDSLFEDNNFVVGFIEFIQKKFPEITLKGNHSLRGVADGRFQSININNRFMKKIEDFYNIYNVYGYLILAKDKNADDYIPMSIGEFLTNANKYKAKIITRYKGLGEANSKQLWDTTLNPNTRILIQLTMDDVQRDLEIFEKLHGTSKKNLEDRKDMIAKYKIRKEDLDN